jgi:hypothetical protein
MCAPFRRGPRVEWLRDKKVSKAPENRTISHVTRSSPYDHRRVNRGGGISADRESRESALRPVGGDSGVVDGHPARLIDAKEIVKVGCLMKKFPQGAGFGPQEELSE